MFNKFFGILLFFLICGFGFGSDRSFGGQELNLDGLSATLSFEYRSHRISLDASDFRAAGLQLRRLSVRNPAYGGRVKVYFGYLLVDIFKLAGVPLRTGQSVTFVCRDGYEPTLDLASALQNSVGLLAIGESNTNGHLVPFSKVTLAGGGALDPAPYYLVWSDGQHYPLGWPFQLHTIRVKDQSGR